jgi:hypothetical protein
MEDFGLPVEKDADDWGIGLPAEEKQAEAEKLLEEFKGDAELMGSRGRALMYGRPEPEGRDYDYTVFTDDPVRQDQKKQQLQKLIALGFKQNDRPGGFLTATGLNHDVSVHPVSKRQQILDAWELMEGGMPKDEAWALLDDQAAKTAESATEVRQRVADQAKKTDTDPTEAQKDSGRYRKGRVGLHGLRLAIENPKGSTRSGTAEDGTEWHTKMHSHYGYVEGTEGADTDPVDIFLGDEPHSEYVVVINQVNPGTKKFDEHKVMLGYTSAAMAKKCYLKNYDDGWKGLGSATAMTMDQFKWWLEQADTSKEIKDGHFAAPKNLKKQARIAREPQNEKAFWAYAIDNNKEDRDSGEMEHLSDKERNRLLRAYTKERTALRKRLGPQIAEALRGVSEDKDYPGENPVGGVSVWSNLRGTKLFVSYGDWESSRTIFKAIKTIPGIGDAAVDGDAEAGAPDWEPYGGDWAGGAKDIEVYPTSHAPRIPWKRTKKGADEDDRPFTVAVDLDGTLAKHYRDYDEHSIPEPRPGARTRMLEFRKQGHRIIVFTVRGNEQVVRDWLQEHKIPFDYINENPDQPEGASDKVYADVYVDDRGIDARTSWKAIAEEVAKREKKAEETAAGGAAVPVLRRRLRVARYSTKSQPASAALRE